MPEEQPLTPPPDDGTEPPADPPRPDRDALDKALAELLATLDSDDDARPFATPTGPPSDNTLPFATPSDDAVPLATPDPPSVVEHAESDETETKTEADAQPQDAEQSDEARWASENATGAADALVSETPVEPYLIGDTRLVDSDGEVYEVVHERGLSRWWHAQAIVDRRLYFASGLVFLVSTFLYCVGFTSITFANAMRPPTVHAPDATPTRTPPPTPTRFVVGLGDADRAPLQPTPAQGSFVAAPTATTPPRNAATTTPPSEPTMIRWASPTPEVTWAAPTPDPSQVIEPTATTAPFRNLFPTAVPTEPPALPTRVTEPPTPTATGTSGSVATTTVRPVSTGSPIATTTAGASGPAPSPTATGMPVASATPRPVATPTAGIIVTTTSAPVATPTRTPATVTVIGR